jgi:hypothetical protein
MRLALAIAAAALLLTGPVLAQESRLAIVAKVSSGLADGGETLIGALGKGKVTEVGDGVFEIALKDGVAKFLFEETDTCKFAIISSMENQPTTNARFDTTKITAIEVRDQGEWEGLKAVLVTVTGADGTLEVMIGDAWINQPMFSFLASNLTADEIKAAADELLRIC